MSRAGALSLCTLAIGLAAASSQPAAAVVIDSFTTNQATVSDPPGGATVVTGGADIIGTRRTLSPTTLSGAGPSSGGVAAGALTVTVTATTPDSRGEVRLAWDGNTNPNTLDPLGLGGVDLTTGNHTGLRVRVNSATVAGSELVVIVHTSATDRSRAARRLPLIGAATDVFLPFSAFRAIGGSGADFADVGAIELIVRATESTVTIDLIDTAGATLAATKVDLTTGDVPIGSTPQTPGTTLRYRVTVTNSGGEAVNSAVVDTLDTNLALVANSIDASPVAVEDQYGTPGNVGVSVLAAQGLLANDVDPDGGTVTVTTVGAIPTALGGTATVAADGSFSYAPPAGVGTAVDSFDYSVVDNEANPGSATATIHIGDRIWFVDNNHCSPAPCGTGTFADPFGSLPQAQTASFARDTIFLFTGSGPYPGGIALKNRQRLIGRGTDLIADGVTLVAAGTAPIIANAAGAGVTLAQDNTASGFTVGNTSGAGISGASFGTFTASAVAINGTGNILDLDQGTLAATFDALASTSSVRAIELTNVGGSLTATGTTLTGGTSQGIFIDAAPVSASFNFGPTSINGAAGVSLTTSPSTTTTFASLAVTATAGAGLVATNAGALAIGGGANTVVATGGPAIDLTSINLGAGATFTTVSSSGSASNGINLNAVTGNFVASGGAIGTATGIAFDLAGGNSTVTYAGSITNTAGRSIEITGRTGGTVTLSGNINDTGTGINIASNTGGTINLSGSSKALNTGTNAAVTLATNTGATINFTGGGLDIDTTAGSGFSATGGAAAITVQGTNNTITSTTGTALNVANTTIGASGLTFQSISSNGGSNAGIVLVSTGSSGSLTVTGTGSAGSGGTIANKSGGNLPGDLSTSQGVGIFLNNTTAPSFTSMQLNDFSNFAIRGNNVTGLTLASSVVNGTNGNDAGQDEGSVRFTNLTGSASISNSNFSGAHESNFAVVNSSGTLDRITFSSATFGPMSTTDGNDGLVLESLGSAVIEATVQNSTFTHARGDIFNFLNNGTATNDLIFTGNAITNAQPGIATGGGGVTISGGDLGGSMTFAISNNTFRDSDGHGILIVKSTGAGTYSGTFANNQIGVAAVANSGSVAGSGLKVQNAGQGAVTIAITGNTIRQYNNFGIELLTGGGASAQAGALNATITGNTVGNSGTGGLPMNGIHLNGGTVPGDTYQICVDAGGAGPLANSIAGSGANVGTDIRLRQRQSTTVQLRGYAGGNTDVTAVQNYLIAQNSGNGAPTALASTQAPGGGFVNTPGGAPCPTP